LILTYSANYPALWSSVISNWYIEIYS